MIKISTLPDCGNSPKAALLKDFNLALAKQDLSFVTQHLDDQSSWNFIGQKATLGKDSVSQVISLLNLDQAQSLELKTIITHGKYGSVEGSLVLNSGQTTHFCHTYTFTSHSKTAKLATINSYLIESKS